MAISLVQSYTQQGAGTTTGKDTSGATLLVAVASGAVGGISDSVNGGAGNTWTSAVLSGSNEIFYVANPTVGPNHTFTIASGGFPAAVFTAWSGIKTTSPLDQTHAFLPTTPGPITTTDADLVIAGQRDTASGATMSGYIVIEAAFQGGVNYNAALAYLVQSAAGTENPTWSAALESTIASFLPASGPTTITITPTAGALALTGNAVTLKAIISSVTKGTLTLSGGQPILAATITIAPSAGSLTVTGYQPTVQQVVLTAISPTAGALTLTGGTPTFLFGVAPLKGTLTLTGGQPAIAGDHTASPLSGTLTLTGYRPRVTSGGVTSTVTGSMAPQLRWRRSVLPS